MYSHRNIKILKHQVTNNEQPVKSCHFFVLIMLKNINLFWKQQRELSGGIKNQVLQFLESTFYFHPGSCV